MKKITLSIVALSTLVLIGCGGGGGSSASTSGSSAAATDPYKIQEVSYKIENNQIICNKPYHQSISKAQRADDYGTSSCIWICGSYEGAKPVSVSLSFIQNGKDAPWMFDGDGVSTAPAQCHN